MNGVIPMTIRYGKISYEFSLKRNITIIDDYSATGKSTLVRALASRRTGKGVKSVAIDASGYDIAVFTNDTWNAAQFLPELYTKTIIFIDELQDFVDTPEFAKFVKDTGTYFVLITRANLGNLAYSVDEIYTVETIGKKHILKPKYRFENNFIKGQLLNHKPNCILTEDAKSGYMFFNSVAEDNLLQCYSAKGKSNIAVILDKPEFIQYIKGKVLMVVCDRAALGCDIKDILAVFGENCILYAPESFEYMILNSNIFKNFNKDILENTSNYINPAEHVSWEKFYEYILCEISKNTEYLYTKRELNPNYMKNDIKNKILISNHLQFLINTKQTMKMDIF